MNETWRQMMPVVISIFIIVMIALVRAYSKTLAAITATMPTVLPLAIWITYMAEAGDPPVMVDFIESLFFGIAGTVVFVIAAWLAARAGWSLVPMIGAGYLAWGLTLGLSFGLQRALGG